MGERKSKAYLDKIKKKYNVDKLWSWSRYNSYKTDAYGYYLHYICHEAETRQNIYGISGNICHDILEKYYINEIKYDDMIKEYEEKLFEMNISELKYDRNDEEKNANIARKYEENMRLFFQQHIPVDTKVKTEQFVTIKVGKNLFQGYVDFIHKDEVGNFIITDFKTSTIYAGEKINKESGQLKLYAEALVQKGIPLENIRSRWNFLKYCTVEMPLKGKDKETGLHKTKTSNVLRAEWVSKAASNIKMWLKMEGYDELGTEDITQTAIENNNLDSLPENIRNKYKISDCYVYVPLSKDIIDDLKQEIITTIDEINAKEKEYEKTKDDKLFWTEINSGNAYFLACLSGYGRSQHKPYDEYLKEIEMFLKDEKDNSNDDEDFDWLTDL